MGCRTLLFILAFFTLLHLPYTLAAQQLTVYSGRSKALVEPLIQKFETETGIRVRVRYGGTTQLSMALMEEGGRSPADLFWAQDAGALGAVNARDLLVTLPDELKSAVSSQFIGTDGTWIATSGRARVLAYSTVRVESDDLPESIFDLDDPRWRNRIGWAPSNGSFQSFLTAIRKMAGDEATREWLKKIKENGVQNYSNNNAILQAIAAGEIDIGLTNHYYLLRYRENNGNFPVDQAYFGAGDPGNLMNVSGIGVLRHSQNRENALKFIRFLITEEAQNYFAQEIYEFPVIAGVELALHHGNPVRLNPDVDLDDLGDLEATLKMLREVGLL